MGLLYFIFKIYNLVSIKKTNGKQIAVQLAYNQTINYISTVNFSIVVILVRGECCDASALTAVFNRDFRF